MNLREISNFFLVQALAPTEKQAAGILDWVKDNPATATGIGTGVLGGALTAAGRRQPGESRTARTMRILRNALLTGAMGGGSVAALRAGGNQIASALPQSDVDPATRALTGTTIRTGLGLTGAGVGAHLTRNYSRNPADATKSIIDGLSQSVTQNIKDPGVFKRMAQGTGRTDVSDLSNKVLTGLASRDGRTAGGLKNLFEGVGKKNIAQMLDELNTNAVGREEMLRNFTRAGINTVERGGGVGNWLRRNIAEPGKMMAWRHMTPMRVLGVGGGAAAGAFAPDIARGVVNQFSNE